MGELSTSIPQWLGLVWLHHRGLWHLVFYVLDCGVGHRSLRETAVVVMGFGSGFLGGLFFLYILLIACVVTGKLTLPLQKRSVNRSGFLSDLVSAFLDVEWTEWFNHDKVPQSKGGEKISDLRAAHPGKICNRPIDIQVPTSQQPGNPPRLCFEESAVGHGFLLSLGWYECRPPPLKQINYSVPTTETEAKFPSC